MERGILVKAVAFIVLPLVAFFLGRSSVKNPEGKIKTESFESDTKLSEAPISKVPDQISAPSAPPTIKGSEKTIAKNLSSSSVRPIAQEAAELIKQGKEKEALALFNEALLKNPDDPALLMSAAQFYLSSMQNPEKASELFEKAYNLKPENFEAFNGMVSSLYNLGPQQATERMKKVADANPDRLEANLALGDMYLASGKKPEALQALEKARRADDNDPQVFQRIADLHESSGDRIKAGEALAQQEKLIDLNIQQRQQKDLDAPRMEKDKVDVRMRRVMNFAARGNSKDALSLLDESRNMIPSEAYQSVRDKIIRVGQNSE
jgi:tetratricopeptide (TPR) repeat protein